MDETIRNSYFTESNESSYNFAPPEEANAFYDMFGGYYPGKPIYGNRSSGGGGYAPKLDSVPNIFSVNEFLIPFEQSLDLPRWGVERFVKEFDNSLKIRVSGYKTVDVEELGRRGAESIEDAPGVAVVLDIDPRKWIEDPGGMAKKTVKSWASGVLDWDDFDNKARAKLWNELLSDDKSTVTRDRFEQFEKDVAFKTKEEMTSAIERVSGKKTGRDNPLSLDTGIKVKNSNTDHFDRELYGKTKASILEFQLNASNVIAREDKYDAIILNSANDMSNDIRHQVHEHMLSTDRGQEGMMRVSSMNYFDNVKFEDDLQSLINSGAPDWQIDNRINSMVGTAMGNPSMVGVDPGILRDQAKQLESTIRSGSVKASQDLITKQNLNQYGDFNTHKFAVDWRTNEYQQDMRTMLIRKHGIAPSEVDQVMSHINGLHARTDIANYLDDLSDKTDKFQKSLDRLATSKGSGLKDAQNDFINLKKVVTPMGPDEVDKLIAFLPAGEKDKYSGLLQSFRGEDLIPGQGAQTSLRSLVNEIDTTFKGDISNLSRADILKLRGKTKSAMDGGLIGESIKGGDFFRKGTQRKVLRDMHEDWFRGGPEMASLSRVTRKGGVISSLIPKLEEERAAKQWEEIFNALEKGDLMDVYVWNRLKKKYEYFTPSYWVKQGLSKVNNFGLSIDNKSIFSKGGADYAFGISAFGQSMGFMKLTNRNGEAKGMFANSFGVKFAAGGKDFNVNLTGGSHFGFVNALKGHMKEGHLSADELKKLLSAKDATEFATFAKGLSKLKLSDDEIKKWGEGALGFKKWAQKHHKMFGISKDAAGEGEFLHGLFGAVHEYNLDLEHWGVGGVVGITNQYAGPLQKVFKHLNHLQTEIFDRFGKFIAPVSHAKTYIINKIARGSLKKVLTEAITKALEALGTGVTEGLGAPIIAMIEPAIRFVVKKTLDVAEALGKALLKGDFSAIFAEFNKAVHATVRLILMGMAIPLFMAMLIFVIMGQVLGGFSPVDPSIMGGGERYNPNGNGGGSAIAPSCDTPEITPNNCIFQSGGVVSNGSYSNTGSEIAGAGCDDPDTSFVETHCGGDGHGSNDYWNFVGGYCVYNVPTLTSGNPADGSTITPNNACYMNQTYNEPFYGWAADVVPQGGGCFSVYLPNIAESWEVGSALPTDNGQMVVAIGTNGGTNAYKMTLLHMGNGTVRSNQTLEPGDQIAETWLWGASNSHIHIELQVWNAGSGSWVPVVPETVLCN